MTPTTQPRHQLEAEEGLTLAGDGVYPDAMVNIRRAFWLKWEHR